MTDTADLLARLRQMRTTAVDGLARGLDPDGAAPEIGKLTVLAAVQTSIAAVEAEIEATERRDDG